LGKKIGKRLDVFSGIKSSYSFPSLISSNLLSKRQSLDLNEDRPVRCPHPQLTSNVLENVGARCVATQKLSVVKSNRQ
jgi:hypothetical protein